MPICYVGNFFIFNCDHTDLEFENIKVTCTDWGREFGTEKEFMRDVMEFNIKWFSYVGKRLNGWSGFDCVNFELDDEVKKCINR